MKAITSRIGQCCNWPWLSLIGVQLELSFLSISELSFEFHEFYNLIFHDLSFTTKKILGADISIS